MAEMAVALGPAALRAPVGPLPADPAADADLPPELAGLKAEAERQLGAWVATGTGLGSARPGRPRRRRRPAAGARRAQGRGRAPARRVGGDGHGPGVVLALRRRALVL